jgi:prophage regulatory protein
MNTPESPAPRFISPKLAHNRTSMSRTTAWRLEKRHQFPRLIAISPGRKAYLESEIDAWIAAKVTVASLAA